MKKKLLITSSLITILLALFPVSLYAEEVVQDPAPATTSAQGVLLDSSFYQNYDLLPYIEGTGTQYINTDIHASNKLRIYLKLSDLQSINYSYLYGYADTNGYRLAMNQINQEGAYQFQFYSGSQNYLFNYDPYRIYEVVQDKNNCYINNNLITTFIDNNFTGDDIYIFTSKYNNTNGYSILSKYKLYSFYIYDYSLNQNNEEIGYVRYYYPAKAKTSGTIGLYDAVSKTFFPSLGSDQFESPTDDKVLHFQISDFITAGLTWIGDILDFAIAEPMILFFMAVGLAGVMYRWARRLVHL